VSGEHGGEDFASADELCAEQRKPPSFKHKIGEEHTRDGMDGLQIVHDSTPSMVPPQLFPLLWLAVPHRKREIRRLTVTSSLIGAFFSMFIGEPDLPPHCRCA